jgi:hypothetical protein
VNSTRQRGCYPKDSNAPLLENIAFQNNSTKRMTTAKSYDLLNQLRQPTNPNRTCVNSED